MAANVFFNGAARVGSYYFRPSFMPRAVRLLTTKAGNKGQEILSKTQLARQAYLRRKVTPFDTKRLRKATDKEIAKDPKLQDALEQQYFEAQEDPDYWKGVQFCMDMFWSRMKNK